MEENENVVDETTKEQTVQTVDESKFESAGDDSVIKVDLSKPVEDENQEETTEAADGTADDARVVGSDENAESVQEQEEVQPEVEAQEQPVVEEITEEEIAEEVEEAIAEAKETGKPLPDNVQKLVDFMEETGGDIQDYVRLNQDYSDFDSLSLLREYYKQTKPHLDLEEIDFMMEDQFSFDEELDDDRDIRRKKLALKEQVAQAKNHLESVKSKYYEDIKAGSKLTVEQQKAVDFFNRYNKESEDNKQIAEKQHRTFLNKTNQLFNKDFKGFEFNVGDKKFRYNVKSSQSVKETQSDINNFVKKFLNEDNTMSDAKGYHKSLFTAMNPDTIAQHFYEQGKADALKESVAKSKNVNMDPRQQFTGPINTGGIKVKVLGDNSSDFKFKIKNRK